MIDIVTEEVLIYLTSLSFVAWLYFLFCFIYYFFVYQKKIMTKKYTGGGLVHIYHRHQSLIIITH